MKCRISNDSVKAKCYINAINCCYYLYCLRILVIMGEGSSSHNSKKGLSLCL